MVPVVEQDMADSKRFRSFHESEMGVNPELLILWYHAELLVFFITYARAINAHNAVIP
jgi:hypothetical protein